MQPDALAEHVRKVIDTFPPLSDAQRAKLTQLLRPTPDRPAIPAPREAA